MNSYRTKQNRRLDYTHNIVSCQEKRSRLTPPEQNRMLKILEEGVNETKIQLEEGRCGRCSTTNREQRRHLKEKCVMETEFI